MENKNCKERVVFLDYLRVIACFMVMVVHSTEPFYLGGEGSLISSYENGLWAAGFDSLVRSCVPLFVIASSYLLFPLKYSTAEFLKKRVVRILIPLFIWSVFYALYWGDPVSNLKDLVFNFNYAAGHLWFVYMLAGLYFIMPLLSPWAEKVEKKELNIYILLWLFTTIIPYLRDWLSTEPLAMTYGPSGLPHQALYPLWGECSWNQNGTFYYVSGMAGYLLIGLWLRKFGDSISQCKSVVYGCLLSVAGFVICFGGFVRRFVESAGGQYPVGGNVSIAVWWETTWCFDTLGVVMMTIGMVLLMKNLTYSGTFYKKVILSISKASFGMYLGHMVALAFFAGLYAELLTSTPLIIICTAVSSYITVAAAAILIQRIPVIGKYIIG